MCGRYYVDDATAREIEKVIQEVDRKLHREYSGVFPAITPKDIHPTEMAPILAADSSGITCRQQRWGLPAYIPKDGSKRVRSYSMQDVSQSWKNHLSKMASCTDVL